MEFNVSFDRVNMAACVCATWGEWLAARDQSALRTRMHQIVHATQQALKSSRGIATFGDLIFTVNYLASESKEMCLAPWVEIPKVAMYLSSQPTYGLVKGIYAQCFSNMAKSSDSRRQMCYSIITDHCTENCMIKPRKWLPPSDASVVYSYLQQGAKCGYRHWCDLRRNLAITEQTANGRGEMQPQNEVASDAAYLSACRHY